jgi:hypothetical protein
MTRSLKLGLAVGLLWTVSSVVSGATIDVSTILGNSSYEDDLIHSEWSVTKPNATYANTVPVNPAFTPLNPAFNDGTTQAAPTAPVGDHYIAVLNPTLDDDIKGRLVHDAESVSLTSSDSFEVVVWANRGRLGSNGNENSTFAGVSAGAVPILTVQLFTWGPGSLPTVDINNDWSRNPSTSVSQTFTDWAVPTDWASQLFSFSPGVDVSYLALGISGQNRNHDQYVAWDIGPVPEPSTLVLAAVGGAAAALLGLLRKKRSQVQ